MAVLGAAGTVPRRANRRKLVVGGGDNAWSPEASAPQACGTIRRAAWRCAWRSRRNLEILILKDPNDTMERLLPPNPMKLLQRPLSWIVLGAVCALGVTYARLNFSKAIPLLRLEISMNREAAAAAAVNLARQHGWSPADPRRVATTFTRNEDLTNFIELEAGGKENLGHLLDAGLITPYRWTVRLFREKDAAETTVFFKPDGALIGFAEKLPESAPGASLGEAEARAIAEREASAYGVNLRARKLVESKSNRTVSGRVDHTFTYECDNKGLGAARDRLDLIVCGDRLCGLNARVQIPDDFFRHYAALRSANNSISTGATIGMGLFLVGGVVGLSLVGRRRGIEWRRPAAVAVGLGLLGGLAGLNALPLAWFDYDTAVSAANFMVQRVVMAVFVGLGTAAIAALILVAAENLSREALPAHLQLWRSFSAGAAASREVFGRVVGGYLLAGLWFAYLVWCYSVGSSRLGWWLPSSPLSDPTILGTPVPWLSPFFNALQAGVLEESLFRAVPLAWAVILGRRFGRPWIWIAATLVLQAVIFGAGHAGYPNQPAWARLAELFTPALVLGALFLWVGLVPCILIHFLYDLVLMSLPLFVSHAPGARPHGVVAILLGCIPLGVVVFARLRAGGWKEFPEQLRYRGWRVRTASPQSAAPEAVNVPLGTKAIRGVVIAGIVAVPVWFWLSDTNPSIPGLGIRRADAVAGAQRVLAGEGVKLDAAWRPLAIAIADSDLERKLVWQTSGEDTFKKLQGNYLACPGWRVRFVRPELPLPDRAEEFSVFIAGDGSTIRYEHQLPETRPGAQLTVDAARTIAERQLRRLYGLDPARIKAIASVEEKRPERKDWRFTWSDPSVSLKQGEARVWIRIQGDALGGYGRYVFVPEDWSRADRAKGVVRGIVSGVCVALLAGLGIAASVGAVRDWMRGRFSVKVFLVVGAAYLGLKGVEFAANLPKTMAGLSTNESFTVQLARMGAAVAMAFLIVSAVVGLWAGQRDAGSTPADGLRGGALFRLGLAAGMLATLAERLVQMCKPHDAPWSAGFEGANAALPCLGSLWFPESLFFAVLCSLCVYRFVRGVARAPRTRRISLGLVGLLCGIAANHPTWPVLALSGLTYAVALPLLDELARRTHWAVIIPFFFARTLARLAWEFLVPGQPDSFVSTLTSFLLSTIAAWLLYRLVLGRAAAAPPLLVPTPPPPAGS